MVALESRRIDCAAKQGIGITLQRITRPVKSRADQKRAYRIANRDRLLARSRAYYRQNRERLIEYAKQYNRDHKESINARRSEWRRNNKQVVRARRAIFYARHSEKLRARNREWRALPSARAWMHAYHRAYYERNKDAITKRNKSYFMRNKGKRMEYIRVWQGQNKDKVLSYRRKYMATEHYKQMAKIYQLRYKEKNAARQAADKRDLKSWYVSSLLKSDGWRLDALPETTKQTLVDAKRHIIRIRRICRNTASPKTSKN